MADVNRVYYECKKEMIRRKLKMPSAKEERHETHVDIYLNRDPDIFMRFRGNAHFDFNDGTTGAYTAAVTPFMPREYIDLICNALVRALYPTE